MGLFDKLFGGNKKDETYIPSAELMPEDRFWSLMQHSRDKAENKYEEQQAELKSILMEVPIQEVMSFDNRFRQLRGDANNWQLWAAIYIIHGGCGDDSFMDFRGWIISRGKDFYSKTIADPASLIEVELEELEVDWEGMGYIASAVFEKRTGKEIPTEFKENVQMKGNEWSEEGDDLKNMYPALWEKYVS
jgi:hypothetical protein